MDSGAYHLQNPPASSATLQYITRMMSMSYEWPNTPFATSMPSFVFQPKSLYCQWFSMATSPLFLDWWPPMWQNKTQKGHMKQINHVFAPPNQNKTSTILLPNPVSSTLMIMCVLMMLKKQCRLTKLDVSPSCKDWAQVCHCSHQLYGYYIDVECLMSCKTNNLIKT